MILGAGFDARAWRLPELSDRRVFELDREATQAHKRARLGAPAQAVLVAGDLGVPGFEKALVAAGFVPEERACFLLEGVTNYLSAGAVDAVLRFVGLACAPGSALLFTYVHRGFLGGTLRAEGAERLRRTLARSQEPWTFGLDPAELPAWLGERGLELEADRAASEYRERILGEPGRGYEFYRAARARVAAGPVPRVSEAHLAARRRQILDAARVCFARAGFHRATMHDGVRGPPSAGAVYRYFRGKEELIAALARERHLPRERAALADASRHGDTAGALGALIRAFLGSLGEAREREDRRLGVQLWAEALRDPKLRRVVRAGALEPRRRLALLLRRAKRRGELPAELDSEAAARLAIAVFHGIVLQQAWEPELDVEALAAALEAAARALVRGPRRGAGRRRHRAAA